MKYVFNLVVLLLGAFFIGGIYVGVTATTTQQTKERRAGIGSTPPVSTDYKKERDEARRWEMRAIKARDSLQSIYTRLHYAYMNLQEDYDEQKKASQKSKAANTALQSQLDLTKAALTTKADSLDFVKRKYFDEADLNQVLVEQNEELQRRLEWEQDTLPRLAGWLLALTILLFAVVGWLLVYIQRQQRA